MSKTAFGDGFKSAHNATTPKENKIINKLHTRKGLFIAVLMPCFGMCITANAVGTHSKIPLSPGVNNKWTADDAPYLKIRQEIDSAISSGTNPIDILQRATTMEEQHPKDPLAVFRLGYASYKARNHAYYHLSAARKDTLKGSTRKPFWAQLQKEEVPLETAANPAVFNLPDPHSFEFSRLRFLFYTLGDEASGGDAQVAEGYLLVQHSPDDWDVKEAFSRILATQMDKTSKELGLKYAKEVVHARPNDPNAWEALGLSNNYFASLRGGEELYKKEYAPAALAAYQKCLELAPPDYGPRSTIEMQIKGLNRQLK